MPTDKEIQPAITVKDLAPVGLFDRLPEVIDKALAMPQAEIPVIHRFAPGLYIREAHMAAGTFVIGHEHRNEHFNVMLSGHLIMVNDDGTTTEYIAPQSYVAKPGHKVAYIVKDVVWQNIFASDETDIYKLEEQFLVKSDQVRLNEEQRFAAQHAAHDADRFSYRNMLVEFGLTEEFVRTMSELKADMIDMPGPVHPYRLANSPIEGTGYFLTVPAKAGMILAPARLGDNRTPAGRYVNHAAYPNAKVQKAEDGNVYLVAIKDINGCMGGDVGEEVTTDYGHTLRLLNGGTVAGERSCQEQ